jgi:hypothetical protein
MNTTVSEKYQDAGIHNALSFTASLIAGAASGAGAFGLEGVLLMSCMIPLIDAGLTIVDANDSLDTGVIEATKRGAREGYEAGKLAFYGGLIGYALGTIYQLQ